MPAYCWFTPVWAWHTNGFSCRHAASSCPAIVRTATDTDPDTLCSASHSAVHTDPGTLCSASHSAVYTNPGTLWSASHSPVHTDRATLWSASHSPVLTDRGALCSANHSVVHTNQDRHSHAILPSVVQGYQPITLLLVFVSPTFYF